MADPIGTLFEAAPEDLEVEATDFIQTNVPGYEPAEGNLEVILIGAVAQLVSVLTTLASQTAADIFRFFGTLVNILSLEPTQATGLSTWTMVDDAGYTIPDGTQIALTGTDGELVGFVTVGDVTVPPSSTVTGTGEVIIESIDPGADTSGLSGDIELIDALAFVDSAIVEDVTAGGTDGETDDEYLSRLTELLTLQAPRPILPDDFAVMVRTSIPGIARAVALDGYNADDETTDQERCVTVGVVDSDGEPVPTPIKTEADDLLQSHREINFLSFVIDPTYTEVDVYFEAVPLAGFDTDDVQTRAIETVTNYLSPAGWGFPPISDPTAWTNQLTVRQWELVSLIDNVPGVDYVTVVQLALAGDTLGTSDISLDGPIAMPRPGTIDGAIPPPSGSGSGSGSGS